MPRTIEIENPATSLPIVTPTPIGKDRFSIILANEPATIRGDGRDIVGNIPNTNTSSHTPTKIAKKERRVSSIM
ncbi:hypothetical protein [Candidatus Nitrosotalea sp. TS]|uniref:hypothetical protein n=1 Tax=Candidatus Nitrosotalea sp. TS TaxID=2341020 RepID=UPI0021038D59|nr:hypothetical protein [Candidatus Nitrosotalea sp. TS]